MKQVLLEIHSSDTTLVPNTFIKQDRSNHLAILFPGLGYTVDMPLLYYTTNVLLDMGADVLQVRYTYQTESFQSLSQETQYQKIIADCSAAHATAIKQRRYAHWKISWHTRARSFTYDTR